MVSEADPVSRRTLIFVVTEDWYFVSHRLPLALAALGAGYRVVVASRFGEHRAQLAAQGLIVVPLALRRSGAGLCQELQSIRQLRAIYREYSPALVHHIALKPVLFGSIASLGLRGIVAVNAIAGLGFLFSSERWRARLARPLVAAVLRLLLPRGRNVVIVQNEEDRARLLRRRIVGAERISLMKGAGVNLSEFRCEPELAGQPIAAFAGRLIMDKGVGAFVDAARTLRGLGVSARFVLIGEPDRGNPSAVTDAALEEWRREGVVELWGRRYDMPAVLASIHLLCLPTTYGEGVPKILLEAAACGRPVVTTDWPGCRDVVVHGETGLLVAPNDQTALRTALQQLLTDSRMRARLGQAARAKAEREFDVRSVVASTLSLYDELSR